MRSPNLPESPPNPQKSLQSSPDPEPTLPSQFLVYDYDSSGKHDFIGEFTSSFQEMQEGTASPGQEVSQRPCPTPRIPPRFLGES